MCGCKRLNKFLRRWSAPVGKDTKLLYKQWKLHEVRDVGMKKGYTCLCGHKNLRFLFFIRNKRTRVETYVGSRCARHFHKRLPSLLRVLEDIPRESLTGTYVGRAGPRGYRFQIRSTELLVRKASMLLYHFQVMPLYQKSNGAWEIRVTFRRRRRLPRLAINRRYALKLSPCTFKGPLPGCWLKLYVARCSIANG